MFRQLTMNGLVLGSIVLAGVNVHAEVLDKTKKVSGTTVHYKVAHRQRGTLEAVAFSAKDGALECLAQRRVTLRAS